MGIIDEVVPEPLGGAHRDPFKMAEVLKEVLKKHLAELKAYSQEKLLGLRYQKYRSLGRLA
jgi:acetyl-CoA carboxylase carboxyl transferase subunit alpha